MLLESKVLLESMLEPGFFSSQQPMPESLVNGIVLDIRWCRFGLEEGAYAELKSRGA